MEPSIEDNNLNACPEINYTYIYIYMPSNLDVPRMYFVYVKNYKPGGVTNISFYVWQM